MFSRTPEAVIGNLRKIPYLPLGSIKSNKPRKMFPKSSLEVSNSTNYNLFISFKFIDMFVPSYSPGIDRPSYEAPYG